MHNLYDQQISNQSNDKERDTRIEKSICQVKVIFTYDGSLNTIFYLDGFATTELRLVDHLSSKYFFDWPQNGNGHNFDTNYQNNY